MCQEVASDAASDQVAFRADGIVRGPFFLHLHCFFVGLFLNTWEYLRSSLQYYNALSSIFYIICIYVIYISCPKLLNFLGKTLELLQYVEDVLGNEINFLGSKKLLYQNIEWLFDLMHKVFTLNWQMSLYIFYFSSLISSTAISQRSTSYSIFWHILLYFNYHMQQAVLAQWVLIRKTTSTYEWWTTNDRVCDVNI